MAALAPIGDEVLKAANVGSEEDQKFDAIVGALEELVLDESFRGGHETFCREHCEVFEHEGENKLVYTSLFQQFQKRTEEAIDVGLRARLPWFDMEAFLGMMASRADELHSDVFDVLMTLAEFEEFKELMLSFKDQVAFERGDGSAPLAPTIAPITTSMPLPSPPHSPLVTPTKTGHK